MIMTKRISCKVVRSVPLGKNSGSPRYPDFAKRVSYPAFNVQVTDICDSVTYTNRVELTSLSADDISAGLNLDCLA